MGPARCSASLLNKGNLWPVRIAAAHKSPPPRGQLAAQPPAAPAEHGWAAALGRLGVAPVPAAAYLCLAVLEPSVPHCTHTVETVAADFLAVEHLVQPAALVASVVPAAVPA